jgi:hypothetical protein
MKPAAGIVLPAVIGVLVLVELLAIAVLSVALQELTVSRERATAIQLQLSARSATAQLSSEPKIGIQALTPGARMPLPVDTAASVSSAEIQRISPALFVLHTTAQVGVGTAWSKASASMLVNGFDAQSALNRIPAALHVAASLILDGSASVDGSTAQEPPASWPIDRCRSWLTQPDSVAAIAHADVASLLIDSNARVAGVPPLQEWSASADSVALANLGGIGLSRLVSWADRQQSGTVDLTPSAAGAVCTMESDNWGAPLDDLHPCATFFPLVHSATDLIIASGAGQGTLIVDGNLTLQGGAAFYGLVIVGGTLTLNPGARIDGAVIARAAVMHGASIRRSNCVLVQALTAASAYNRLVPRRGRRWIPAFEKRP